MKKGILVLLSALALPAADAPVLRGYSGASAAAQREWETKFRALPNASEIGAYVKRLSARPHHVGSAYDRENAEWILSKFREWGIAAEIEKFEVLFPTPRERVVELVEPARFTAKLREPAIAEDPTSGQQNEQLPTYNAYSTDGDVTAPLVYVNFGLPEDYEQLERMGVSVENTIVIARYGNSWRGIKPKVAAEHGALGCIIYSDPQQDGYAAGDVFPRGPYRNRDGVQRGSVMDMPVYPGDPLTPDVGAVAGARRLDRKEARTITRIPVLPISYGDAQPLLEALEGRVVPPEWRGSLPITYHVGPGPAKVHLKLQFNWDIKPLYNVIAKIPGSTYPDEWILRGNHHDAWVNGADDPVSGTAALLEEARAFGELRKQGWQPKRTIVYCVWDGEEEGLLGSTEWGEQHADELRRHAAVYINTDANGRGYLSMAGSHSLEKFINGVARDIRDPEKDMSVWKRQQAHRVARAQSESRHELRTRPDLRIEALGSGSDYTVFIDHLGIASLNLSYGGEDDGGIYHSIYDDYYWYTHFSDGDFVYGRALAQTVGSAVLRLAGADVLPFDFTNLAETVDRYVDELQKLWKSTADRIQERNREIEEGVFRATSDPRRPLSEPKPEAQPPFLNFAPLENAAAALTRSAEHYEKALTRADLAARNPAALNAKLIQLERGLTDAEGLPRRPWYRHQLYAPGFYTGYGVKTIPAVREAIEQKQWAEVETQIARVAKVLENEARMIDAAAAELP
jgi:N-acetylated-alpha-linked acidic dipeptidase